MASYENPWTYEGREIDDDDITEYVAFCYLIENTVTNRKYIGKKKLSRKISKPPLKGKKKRRISKAPSDWKTYYGSSDELNADVEKLGANKFKRTILHLCKTVGESSWFEAKEQFARDALISSEYYNNWISVRVQRSHLKRLVKEADVA